MNVAFYANHPYWSQLNNNGGTRTIIKSVQSLNELGHKARIVAKVDRYTWERHDTPKVKIPKDTDVCIAVSIHDIPLMKHEAAKRCPKAKLAIWLRSWPTNQMPEEKIIKKLDKFSRIGTVLVNAGWLKDHLIKNGVESELVWAGFDEWEPHIYINNIEKIGCLYNPKLKTKRWQDFLYMKEKLGDAYEYISFGVPKKCRTVGVKYISNPKHSQKEAIYGGADIWFCPTVSEGFHQVGMEAGLCGCVVVGPDKPSCGMHDYLNNETGIIYNDLDDAVEKIQKVDYNKGAVMHDYIFEKIGDRERNMKKLVEVFNA